MIKLLKIGSTWSPRNTLEKTNSEAFHQIENSDILDGKLHILSLNSKKGHYLLCKRCDADRLGATSIIKDIE